MLLLGFYLLLLLIPLRRIQNNPLEFTIYEHNTYGENMNLWQTFELKRNTAVTSGGIYFHYQKGIEPDLKQKYISFEKWLRVNYYRYRIIDLFNGVTL